MLKISEHFYSIQGEGASVGVPAYFIRLQGCNLMCGGPSGSLVKEGKATWWCDSETIWRQGTDTSYEDLIADWIEQDVLNRILNGQIHIVWTGGEPTIPMHTKAIKNFLAFLDEKYPQNTVFNEIETNGTLVVEPNFYHGAGNFIIMGRSVSEGPIQQINCSPKLANSGMAKSMRINPEAIEQIKNNEFGYFKFVVSTEEDIEEIQNEWIIPFNIDPTQVIIMPGCDNRADLAERTKFLFEMTKKYGYRGITRQHILAYDLTTGV